MRISATIKSEPDQLETTVQTNGQAKHISIAPKTTGPGSSVNGGELLLLSIATCFCNDLYREAGKRAIRIKSIEVTASGEFGAEGEPGSNFRYQTHVTADATQEEIASLIEHTDKVAEIHNTLRKGVDIRIS